MAQEIDAAALDSLASVAARAPKHGLPVGAPCPNCRTLLVGPWCHACGQSAEDFHRSLVRLAGEAIEGVFEFDGRIWRTLPDLCLRPARLTRAYLDGHRVSQIPPFRLFLVVVVLVFLVAGLGPSSKTVLKVNGPSADVKIPGVSLNLNGKGDVKAERWLSLRLQTLAKNPERFEASLSEWAQRLSVLFLPMSATLLGLMFFWRRGVYLFDHLIFSMHSLSFQGLLLALTLALANLSDGFGWLMAIAPAHLFVHLKGTYSLGVFGTLVRMVVLFLGSIVGLIVAMLGLTFIGLLEATP
jgi:hypothetical protein